MSQSTARLHQGQPVAHAGAALDRATSVVILLHGRGATAESILTLSQELTHPDVAFAAPQANGNTWYPYSFLAPLQNNEPWLTSALQTVGDVLKTTEEAGIPAERTILLGFSQGACLAAEYAARHPQRYGGVVCLSGGLIGMGQREGAAAPEDKYFDYIGSLERTPIFLGCSDVDPHIPILRVQQTTEVFVRLGGDVTERIYPGMGHTINEDEITFIQEMLGRLARTG